MAGNFAAASDFCAFLNLYERADLGVVSDFAAVEIGETEDAYIAPKLHVGCDLLVWLRDKIHGKALFKESSAMIGKGGA